MNLRPFEHLSASSLAQAADWLACKAGRARAIAGGTDLLGALKDNIHPSYPELLVDLKRIPGLDGVRKSGAGVSVGSMTRLADLAGDGLIRKRYPLLASAAKSVASPQVRNMATVGGNICQEPRCWYYRAPENAFHCMRKGGDRCAALLGDHRFHSVFGAVRTAAPACSAACPGRVGIPAYLERVRAGDLASAAAMLLERNPMPAITGRVCPHRCEAACNRAGLDEAVAIRAMELHVGAYALENAGELMKAPSGPGRGAAAVVGSGPAGLSAAYYLRKAGLAVTVFEKMPEPGGMLAYGIPAYRLPPDVLAAQIRAYEAMGIEFRTGVGVGPGGSSLESLRRRFQAVFVATGAWKPKALAIPGAGLLRSGLALLRDVRLGRPAPVGRRVLVIGGGSVALDVAVTARRLGAAAVTVACLESRAAMPAFPEDIEQALAEGIELLPSWGPRRVLASGRVARGLELVRCTSVLDRAGRFAPAFDPAVTRTVEADHILLAIGQSPDLRCVGRGVKTSRGLIAADPETGATSLAGVFAGGDAVSGPATVIEAIAAGRRAAEAIASSLDGGETPAGAGAAAARPPTVFVDPKALEKRPRARMPEAPAAGRGLNGDGARVLEAGPALEEAGRCMDCSCAAVHASDLGPALVALGAVVKTNRRLLSAEEFFQARPASTTALGTGELVAAVELPRQRPGARQGFLKFRLRRSMDFPVLSAASVIAVERGRVRSARLALGAAAPAPLRLRAVEEFLAGKLLSPRLAARAAELAAEGARPLPGNAWKVRIISALVRRLVRAAMNPP